MRERHQPLAATAEAYHALTDQPDPIFIPCDRLPDETDAEFAARLRTVLTTLIRAVEEFGLEGQVRDWLGRVKDWDGVDWVELTSLLERHRRSPPDRLMLHLEEPRAAA